MRGEVAILTRNVVIEGTTDNDIGCQVYTVPSLENYNWSNFPPHELGLFKVGSLVLLSVFRLQSWRKIRTLLLWMLLK